MRYFLFIFFLLGSLSYAQNPKPQLYLFLGGDDASTYKSQINNACTTGVQIIYSWKQLEPQKGNYNFSKIEEDLAFLKKFHKKLFLQLQDRNFQPDTYPVPDYIREEKIYHGGVAMQTDIAGEGLSGEGWVARQWDPAVRYRFHLLIEQLAKQFDGKIAGINLPETAVDFDLEHPPEGFTSDNYFYAEMDNMAFMRNTFHNSIVLQYINFFPDEWINDHNYTGRMFSFAAQHNIALGGPDTLPYEKRHSLNSYPFFNQYKNQMRIGMGIQEPDYTYHNPHTNAPYTFDEFYQYATDYLGARIFFWNTQEPFYSEQLAPHLNSEYFECE